MRGELHGGCWLGGGPLCVQKLLQGLHMEVDHNRVSNWFIFSNENRNDQTFLGILPGLDAWMSC